MICAALRVRWSNGLRMMYAAITLGVFTPCKALRPLKAGAMSTPSTLRAVSMTLRVSSSVRDSDEPSGSLVPANR